MPNILGLVRKDFLLMRRYLWLLVIYAVAFSGIISGTGGTMLYGLLPGVLLILTIGADMRQPNQQFLVSLPLKRNQLVLAKYASSFIILVLSIAVCLLMNIATDLLDFGTVRINTALAVGTTVTMSLFISVYLPLYYWLGLKGAQYLNVGMMVIIMIGNGAVTSLLGSRDMAPALDFLTAHRLQAGLLIGSGTVLVIVVSYLISRSIFMKRDL
ncbi:ABC-2 transporter permease [Paenibacillus sp. M1]|uniref:ABC-2 transporter permease n=1 Tax=Paenibacillus haidiansis TaxID=1574488 RepID=A0ABU7VQR6_9BACL